MRWGSAGRRWSGGWPVAAALVCLLMGELTLGVPAGGAAARPELYGRVTYRTYDHVLFLLLDAEKRLIWYAPLSDSAIDAVPETAPIRDVPLTEVDWPPEPAGELGWLEGRLALRTYDVAVFLIHAGEKHLVWYAPLGDEEIDAIPETLPLADTSLLGLDLSPAPPDATPSLQPTGPVEATSPSGSTVVPGMGSSTATTLKVSGSISGWRQSGPYWQVSIWVMVLRNGQPVTGAQVSVDFEGDVRALPDTGPNGATNATVLVNIANKPGIGGVITACVKDDCSSTTQYVPLR